MQERGLEMFSPGVQEWFLETLGEPTQVQRLAWPLIAQGEDVLVSAPTGTGKTLCAFLVFIDHFKKLAAQGELEQGLRLLYISPLKSLAADIRENLRRPLEGIAHKKGETPIEVAIRTGDTTPQERRRMQKHPPHILITTPESLFLLLTSLPGRNMLQTVRTVIIDELHALIDTKRGAHLLFSVARLERLTGKTLQRIGLSATIEPLSLAAQWLSCKEAAVVAPRMEKARKLYVQGAAPQVGRRKDPVWEELAEKVYARCLACRSVIAFSEGRRYAEKLAYYVNQLGGPDFARVHHGSLSKEQRQETEEALREGRLRLLCATSSMELGIDVGEIDQVLQVGCPRTIAGCLQRLGRAGHSPGRVSVMYLYPRTAPEGIECGITAWLVREGMIEQARPPRQCLDVLAQHLVSMAAVQNYDMQEVLLLTKRAWSFRDVTPEQIRGIWRMLSGDWEHAREVPARPRILYDRLHDMVIGDAYSRLLAVAAGGTIPDKGLYTAKTADGVKLGELDEEFVYESRLGDKFLLGAFGWKIIAMDKDTVMVEPAPSQGARLPFWKGEIRGRSLATGLAFGGMYRRLGRACERGKLAQELEKLGLDDAAVENGVHFLKRQIASTGILPDDKTIVAEHFRDASGSHQIMYHSFFGRRINAPLALLLQYTLRITYGLNAGCVDEEEGILLYGYGQERLPEGLFLQIDPERVRDLLEAMLPQTPVFSMTFRYNAARALMTGMRRQGRQPLWMQRLRSTQMLDSLMGEKEHPLMEETRRECLEDLWDIEGVLWVLSGIRAGLIALREVYTDTPSPMSLPLQWQVEAEEMYAYTPVSQGIRDAVSDELKALEELRPSPGILERTRAKERIAADPDQLHSQLMIEGDREAGELQVPGEWLEELADAGKVCYIEPGLWIAAEQTEAYGRAGISQDVRDEETAQDIARQELAQILRRMLYYRGAKTLEEMESRYCLPARQLGEALEALSANREIVEAEGIYYHARLYREAQKATIKGLRSEAVTRPPESYAALTAYRAYQIGDAGQQVKDALERYQRQAFPIAFWEEILLPARVKNYREAHLDSVLAQGEYTWRLTPEGSLYFVPTQDLDWQWDGWDQILTQEKLSEEEGILYRELAKRGASFLKPLSKCLPGENVEAAQEALLGLAQKGLVCADSFLPVRQWLNRDKLARRTLRQRVNARVAAMSAGRWELTRPVCEKSLEEWLEHLFTRQGIVCRETWQKPEGDMGTQADVGKSNAYTWADALKILRIWEYRGTVRRGYFVKGLSGAQFIRKEDYPAVTNALAEPEGEIIWLNAADPAQIWGKILERREVMDFTNVPGTATALYKGYVVAVMERNGARLRIAKETDMGNLMHSFVQAYEEGRVFGNRKRLVVKDYPAFAADALKEAGFRKEMQDFVLYR